MKINRSARYQDWGLLLLRLGLGAMFILAHGYGKIFSPEKWEMIGSAIGNLGVPVFAPKVFGFLAAFAEFGGGIMLILGLFFRPGVFLMLFVMITATAMHAHQALPPDTTAWQHFTSATSRPLELAFVFLGLLIAGPGRYALDNLLFKRRRRA